MLLADSIPKRHKDCTFDNFKVTEGTKDAFEFCKGWDGKDSIVLTGKTGTGKTHLAVATLKNMPRVALSSWEAECKKVQLESYAEKYPDKDKYRIALDNGSWKTREPSCLFVPMVGLFIELNEASRTDEGKKHLLDTYSLNYDCICFDDFGAEKLSEAKRENIYYIIDTRYREMKSTIITSNFTIQEINEVEPRIASRFAEMGKIFQLNTKDYRKGGKQ